MINMIRLYSVTLCTLVLGDT